MLWSDFKSAVLLELPVDKNRIGIATGNPNYLSQQIINCIVELQKLIPAYQSGHETVYGTQDLIVDGLASRGRLPAGAKPLDAYYKMTGRVCVSHPLVIYDWGNRYDMICGAINLRDGQYCMAMDEVTREFLVYPAVFDDHQVSLFWAGVKQAFDDADETPFDQGVAEAVGLFCKAKIVRMVDHDLAENASYQNEYTFKKRFLYADARELNRFRYTEYSAGQARGCGRYRSLCPGGPIHPRPDVVEFCAFGDSGDPATLNNTLDVSTLVKSLEPAFVMHLGDSNYPSGQPPQFQQVLINPYGLYIPENFYLAYGNHDIETDGGAFLFNLLTKQKALNGGKTYYSFIPHGDKCQIFVLDTNKDPAEQAAWLQQKLATSCMWNIVCMHKSPYTSDDLHYPGETTFRFPFREWGAHVVLAGHDHSYERIWVDNFQYVNCGLGGAPKRGFHDPPVDGSQFRYNAFYGCLYVTATKHRLQVSFFDTRGEPVDSIEFTSDNLCPQPVPNDGGWCSYRGSQSPEGVIPAPIGCWYRRASGNAFEIWEKTDNDGSPFGWTLTTVLSSELIGA